MAVLAVLTTIFAIIGVVFVAGAAFLYFVGLPEEWQQSLQSKILQEAGENQAGQLLHDQVGKLPKADRKKAEQLQKGIGKVTGGDLQNPLGSLGLGGDKKSD